MKGEVAEAYGSLIERLWSGTANSLAPREFKVYYVPEISSYLPNTHTDMTLFELAYNW
jgi:hypothetical protein